MQIGIERVIENQHKCPMCRAELKDLDRIVHPRAEFCESVQQGIDTDTSSSKIEALLSILQGTCTCYYYILSNVSQLRLQMLARRPLSSVNGQVFWILYR